MILYKDNDNAVELLGLKNNITGGWINNSANVKARLEGLNETDFVADQTLTYLTASNGDYRGIWDVLLLASVPVGDYRLVYTCSEGGLDMTIRQAVTVANRDV